MKRTAGCVLWGLFIIGLIQHLVFTTEKSVRIEERTQEMDLVSTISFDGYEKLVIVANCETIENKFDFAEDILKK